MASAPRLRLPAVVSEFFFFLNFFRRYVKTRGYSWFSRFEVVKGFIVDLLYKKRGKYARPFLHFGTIGLTFFVITFGPVLLERSPEGGEDAGGEGVLFSSELGSQSFYTLQAEEVKLYRGGEVTEHIVVEGETFSSIAQKYGLEESTLYWENNLTAKSKLKPGQQLRILPVDGVRHKVARGETIFSIAKKYRLDKSQAQVIVDYPFNEFLDNETFSLATGQFLVVPGGEKPDPKVTGSTGFIAAKFTPDAGSVSATGSFGWPAQGRLTQGYRFYHRAIDIANKSGGPILAADSGIVEVAGGSAGGYGRMVTVNHGNGHTTLYAHLSVIQVKPGQRVNRGDVLGQMGSTGRSTGVHLHFEIRRGGVLLNPLTALN